MRKVTVSTLLRGIDVKSTGAIGDGTTDDVADIQEAIDAAKALSANVRSGAEVKFPEGHYKISSPLILPRNGSIPDEVVHLVGSSMYTTIIEGTAAFPPNRGLIEWEGTTSRVCHGRIANLSFRCPTGVDGVRAIYHKVNKVGGLITLADVEAEWFQCDLENLYFEGSNQDVEVFIDLEVGNRFATIRNLFGDPWRGGSTAPEYDTLLLRVPYQYNGTDPLLGEDSVGIGLSTLENLLGMIRQGGYCRTFQGRTYVSSWNNCFNNGGLPGRSTGGIGYEFRNSFDCSLTNISSEGGGGQAQFKFYKCRSIKAELLTVPTGTAVESAWAATTVYAAGARVIPTLLASPTAPAPRNRVYTCTVGGTSGGSEPTWPDSGTFADGSVTWSTSAGPAASNGIEFEQCENMVFDTHYDGPGNPPPSYRLVKAIKIDADCRDVKLTNWTQRVISTGAPSTDAANEIEILAAAADRNYVTGEVVQSFGDVRESYRVGYGQEFLGGTLGSVVFVGANGVLEQDNANLHWDNTNNWLGIGGVPATTIDSAGSLRARGAALPATGIGVEIHYAGAGYLQAYDRDTSAYKDFFINNTITLIGSTLRVGIGETAPDYKLDVNGPIGFTPGASVTPVDNGDVVFEATNNTTLTVKLKGSDGTVRSGTVTLS